MVLKERRKVHLRARISQIATVVGGEGLAAYGLVFLDAGVLSAGLRVTELLKWEGDSGQADPRGVWNVTFFCISFSYSMVPASMSVVGALLETLNLGIPSWSEAV